MKLVMTADGLRLSPDFAARHSAARDALKSARRTVRACEATNFAACLANAERSRSDRLEPMHVEVDVMLEHDDSGRYFDSFSARVDTEDVSVQEHFASEYADELTGLFQAAYGDGLAGNQDFSFTVSKDSSDALIETGDPLAFLRAVSADDARAQEICCAVLEEAAMEPPIASSAMEQPGDSVLNLHLTVRYELNGETLETLGSRLQNMVQAAASDGLITGDSAATVERYTVAVTAGRAGAASTEGRQSNVCNVVYLTNALGELTGYGTVEVTDDLLQRVPFENGPGFVLPYLVEVDGRAMVLGNLEISYTSDDGSEIRPGRQGAALSQANEITERIKQRSVHRPEVRLLATEDDGRHVVVRVLAPLQDTASATRTLLEEVFGGDAEGWIDAGGWV